MSVREKVRSHDEHKNAAPSYMQISLNWTLLRMPHSWHSPFNANRTIVRKFPATMKKQAEIKALEIAMPSALVRP